MLYVHIDGEKAAKVNGMKVELTAQEPYTYTITDIRENKTVTVEGVAKKPGGKPSDGGDKGEDPKPNGTDSGQPTDGTPARQSEVKLGNGTVIVTVVCEEEKCTDIVNIG